MIVFQKIEPGYWCSISGRIEIGELEEQDLVREAREEIGLLD